MSNRDVNVKKSPFRYDERMDALQAGRTFITNGPALLLTVDGQMPGATLRTEPGKPLAVQVAWQSHYPVERVEVVWNGRVVESHRVPEGSREGTHRVDVPAASDGWLAARLTSAARDSYFQPVYAHTSPVYVETGKPAAERQPAARFFHKSIDDALDWVGRLGRFQNEPQRREVTTLFREGQQVYRRMQEK